MFSTSCHRPRVASAFTFVEAIFTIAIIGIMSALALSAISNGARDANRIVARQQQAAIQESLVAWVMGQSRVGNTAQVRSLSAIRNSYNAVPTTYGRFSLILPNPNSTDPNVRSGYVDSATADHFESYHVGSERLYSAALKGSAQYLNLPTWIDGGFPTVELVSEQ